MLEFGSRLAWPSYDAILRATTLVTGLQEREDHPYARREQAGSVVHGFQVMLREHRHGIWRGYRISADLEMDDSIGDEPAVVY